MIYIALLSGGVTAGDIYGILYVFVYLSGGVTAVVGSSFVSTLERWGDRWLLLAAFFCLN